MGNYKLSYESRGTKNYLSIKSQETLSTYRLKMLEHNEIPGLLRLHSRVLNGIQCLDYDISGMERLRDVLVGRRLHGESAKALLVDIANCMVGMEEYFLEFSQCLLHIDYMFLDSRQKVRMAYLPFESLAIVSQERIRQFYQSILAEYFTTENDAFYIDLLRYASRKDFSFAGLRKLLDASEKHRTADAFAVKPVQPVQNAEYRAAGSPSGGNFPDRKYAADSSDYQVPVKERPLPDEREDAVPVQKPLEKLSGLSGLKPFGKSSEKAGKQELKPLQEASDPAAVMGFAVPGGVSVVSAAGTAKAGKEKKSLLESLLGGSKKTEENIKEKEKKEEKKEKKEKQEKKEKKEKKNEKQDAFSGIPQGQEMYASGIGQESGEAWKGTVMFTDAKNSAATCIIGAEPMPCLHHHSERITLDHFPFVIGKQNADYVINRNVVSRRHASLLYHDKQYFIKDENSSNHTYVNGKQIPPFTEIKLNSGDRIRLADEDMTFDIE